MTGLGAGRPSVPQGGAWALTDKPGVCWAPGVPGALRGEPRPLLRRGEVVRWLLCFGFKCFADRRGVALFSVLCVWISNMFSLFSPSFDLASHCSLSSLPVSFFLPRFCLFASVLLRWLRCCSSVWQPSYFWGIPWVWRGASIRFSPSLYKPSGLDGRQSVRRGYCGCQRRRIRVSPLGGTEGPHKLRPTRNTATPGLKREFLHFPARDCEPRPLRRNPQTSCSRIPLLPARRLSYSRPDSVECTRGQQPSTAPGV